MIDEMKSLGRQCNGRLIVTNNHNKEKYKSALENLPFEARQMSGLTPRRREPHAIPQNTLSLNVSGAVLQSTANAWKSGCIRAIDLFPTPAEKESVKTEQPADAVE